MKHSPKTTGHIEVICGSMFSGKTEELIRRVRRAMIAEQNVKVFKPVLDTRYDEEDIVSHDQRRIESKPVSNCGKIMELLDDSIEVVGIDEAQFFEDPLVSVCQTLADEGRRVIVAGLDQDYTGKPFEPIPELLAVAEYITKNQAVCVECGNPACRSYRVSGGDQQYELGAKDKYEARCRSCFPKKSYNNLLNDEDQS